MLEHRDKDTPEGEGKEDTARRHAATGCPPSAAASRSGWHPVAFCLLLAVAGCCGNGGGAGDGPAPEDLRARWERATAGLDSLEARFRMSRWTPGYDRPIESSGLLRYRRGRDRRGRDRRGAEGDEDGAVAWIRTEEPEAQVDRLTPGRAETWYPDERLLEIHRFDAGSAENRALSDALEILAGGLREERYDIEAAPDGNGGGTLRFVPRDPAVRASLSRIVVAVDRDGRPPGFGFATPDGETRDWTLSRFRRNPTLTEEDLAIRVPEGTEVIEHDETE